MFTSFSNSGAYTAPRLPKRATTPPSPAELPHKPTPKFWYVAEVYKMTRVLEDERKWVKHQLSVEIFVCKF